MINLNLQFERKQKESKKDILPFCISYSAIFSEQIALCFHLFGSYAAIHVKQTKELKYQ